MRRTVLGLIERMMPSATAWRARSWLDQCVMCSPRAIGSRQASWTICALWRGGNLLRASGAGVVHQEFGKAAPLVAPADPPDSGPVALQAFCDGPDRLTARDGQGDTGVQDLEPTEPAVACHRLQDWYVGVGQFQGARLASTHGTASHTGPRAYPQHTTPHQFVA
jgi:hypothetical protein